jgi:hypothetical protein
MKNIIIFIGLFVINIYLQARPGIDIPIDDGSSLEPLRTQGAAENGSFTLKTIGDRTFFAGKLTSPSSDPAKAWSTEIALHYVDYTEPFGPIFEVQMDLGRPENGAYGLPFSLWGMSEERKPIRLLKAEFTSAELFYIEAAEIIETKLTGASFIREGFVRVRFVFDLKVGNFDLYLDGRQVLKNAMYIEKAKPLEIYLILWGGKEAEEGQFSLDNFQAKNLAARTN